MTPRGGGEVRLPPTGRDNGSGGRERPMKRKKTITMAVSLALTVLAVALALIRRTPWCLIAAAAMAVSTLGDAVLAGAPGRLAKIKNRFVKGGIVFFAAHLLYILALAVSAGKSAAEIPKRFPLPFALFLILTAFHGAFFYFRSRSPLPVPFFAATSAYLMTVGVHAAAAFAAFGRAGGAYALNAAGALLFYLSDAILLAAKYGALRGKLPGVLIWITYAPAQLCLILGFFLLRAAPA